MSYETPCDETKRRNYTYSGRTLEAVGHDGIKRRVTLRKGLNGKIVVEWVVFWNGEDKEPLATAISLTMDGLNMLLNLLADFQVNSDLYPEPKEQA